MQVVVLGFHRSNTSLLANWLFVNGLFLGDRLMVQSEHNKKGYYEDEDFVRIHLSIFSENRMDRSGIFKPRIPKISPANVKLLQELVQDRDRKYKVWGFKDPRTVLLVRKAYSSLLCKPYYIIIFRDYQAIVNSVMKREFGVCSRSSVKQLLSDPKGYLLKYLVYPNRILKAWIIYNYEILKLCKKVNKSDRLVIKSESIICKQELILNKLRASGIISGSVPIAEVFEEGLTQKKSSIGFIFNPIFLLKAKLIQKKLTFFEN